MSSSTIPLFHCCSKCKQEKPLTAEFFHRNKSNASGFQYACKECVLEYSKVYHERNRERKAAYDKRYHEARRDSERERKRAHWKSNPEIYYAKRQRREALHLGLPSNFTASDWRRALEYWNYCCAVCGRPQGLWHRLVADHWIPLSNPSCPGTIPWNIVPLCHGIGGCNNQKFNLDPHAWLNRKLGKKKAERKSVEINAYLEQMRNQPTG